MGVFLLESFSTPLMDSMTENPPFSSSTCTTKKKKKLNHLKYVHFACEFWIFFPLQFEVNKKIGFFWLLSPFFHSLFLLFFDFGELDFYLAWTKIVCFCSVTFLLTSYDWLVVIAVYNSSMQMKFFAWKLSLNGDLKIHKYFFSTFTQHTRSFTLTNNTIVVQCSYTIFFLYFFHTFCFKIFFLLLLLLLYV